MHERQFVAEPASCGLRLLRKYLRDPVDVMWEGRCGEDAEDGGGEQNIHMRKSMSWQDFVRREGADVDSLRQFPLL